MDAKFSYPSSDDSESCDSIRDFDSNESESECADSLFDSADGRPKELPFVRGTSISQTEYVVCLVVLTYLTADRRCDLVGGVSRHVDLIVIITRISFSSESAPACWTACFYCLIFFSL